MQLERLSSGLFRRGKATKRGVALTVSGIGSCPWDGSQVGPIIGWPCLASMREDVVCAWSCNDLMFLGKWSGVAGVRMFVTWQRGRLAFLKGEGEGEMGMILNEWILGGEDKLILGCKVNKKINY